MKRLVLLVPEPDTARAIVEALREAGLEDDAMHVIAREGTPLQDLPEATPLERTDFIDALKRGAAIGGATGLLAGLAALALTGGAVVAGGPVLIATALAGGTVGAWAASLIGASVPSEELRRYEDAVEAGELLMLVDVPARRADELAELIRKHHPEAEIKEVKYFPLPLPDVLEE